MTATRRVTGHITIVQEERFRLEADDGRAFLFTLANRANVGAADLHAFRRGRTPVAVDFSGEPDLESGVAQRIRRAEW